MSAEPFLAGGLAERRNATELAAALADTGVRAGVSQAGALRLWFGEHLYEFGSASGDYVVADPCVNDLDTLTAEVGLMVAAMERVGARCRFEVYEGEKLVSYHHVTWPSAEGAQ
ncbi:MAG: hypothetical protein M0D54_10950 [Hyphomonadaceae bacterium JAD_PAG50586_4]|nr:MAG: hypothetical protein M0D54_10950 [Hyphomonadaceae bacterium JAD_PAG50586_4]